MGDVIARRIREGSRRFTSGKKYVFEYSPSKNQWATKDDEGNRFSHNNLKRSPYWEIAQEPSETTKDDLVKAFGGIPNSTETKTKETPMKILSNQTTINNTPTTQFTADAIKSMIKKTQADIKGLNDLGIPDSEYVKAEMADALVNLGLLVSILDTKVLEDSND